MSFTPSALTPDETAVIRGVVEVIARSISGDAAACSAAVDRSMLRLAASGATGGDSLSTSTTWVINELLVSSPGRRKDIVVAVRDHRLDRTAWRRTLVQFDPRDRAVLALHHVAGYDQRTVAAICRRRVSEVGAICRLDDIEPFGAAAADVEPPRISALRRIPVGLVASIVLVALAVGLITHGSGERPTFAATRPPSLDAVDSKRGCQFPPSLPTGDSTVAIQVGAVTRTAVVTMPPADQGQALPLVIDLGDYGSVPTTREAESQLAQLGSSEHFIVVTPAALGELSQWNVNRVASQPDDVEFVGDLVQHVSESVCVDPNRVTVVGYGDGAHLAAVLACDRSDRIAAIVMVAGAYLPPKCATKRPVSVLAISDDTDQLLPVTGGFGPDFDGLTATGTRLQFGSQYQPASMDETMGGWAAQSSCDGGMSSYANGSDTRQVSNASECLGGAKVISERATGGGHTWPTDGAAAAWNFLRDRSLS